MIYFILFFLIETISIHASCASNDTFMVSRDSVADTALNGLWVQEGTRCLDYWNIRLSGKTNDLGIPTFDNLSSSCYDVRRVDENNLYTLSSCKLITKETSINFSMLRIEDTILHQYPFTPVLAGGGRSFHVQKRAKNHFTGNIRTFYWQLNYREKDGEAGKAFIRIADSTKYVEYGGRYHLQCPDLEERLRKASNFTLTAYGIELGLLILSPFLYSPIDKSSSGQGAKDLGEFVLTTHLLAWSPSYPRYFTGNSGYATLSGVLKTALLAGAFAYSRDSHGSGFYLDPFILLPFAAVGLWDLYDLDKLDDDIDVKYGLRRQNETASQTLIRRVKMIFHDKSD